MPVPSTLPDAEISICNRLREVREDRKWSQPVFAKQLGISRVRLGSYEYARAPVRYWLGARLCKEFNINQRWLAWGYLPKNMWIPLDDDLESRIDPRSLYSSAFSKHLSDLIEGKLLLFAEALGCKIEEIESRAVQGGSNGVIGDERSLTLHAQIARWQRFWIDLIPPELHQKFFEFMARSQHEFMEIHKPQINVFRKQWLRGMKKRAFVHLEEEIAWLTQELAKKRTQRENLRK